jgi:ketosteroid isomerase-like protein
MTDTPSAVVGELIQRVNDGRWTELAGLYAEDALVEHPLRRTHVTGRKAIGDRFAALGTVTLKAFDVTVHETADPELVVAEYGYRGPGFTSANVQVVRVRDGLITHSRDYHDHLRMAAARGDLTGIVAPYVPSQAGPPPAQAPEGTPRAVLHRLLDSIAWEENQASRADLYADDAYVTHPFHPTAPAIEGRDELRQHFARPRGYAMKAQNIVFHEGADPELVVAEFDYVGTAAGNPVLGKHIFVTRVRDGLIVESRDYADYVAVASATGQLTEMIAAARSVVTSAGGG